MTSGTGWPQVAIRNVYAGLYDGPHATPAPSETGPVFLGIGNVTENGHLDLSSIRHIAEEEFDRWTKRVTPCAGDIVFTYEATLNRYAIIPDGFRGCLGRRMALIRPDESKALGRFLYYYFFAPEWRSVIARNTLSGSTVDRIPLTKFPDFPVALPPIDVQRRIVGVLSAYDDLIENNTRRIAILEEMARRLYEEWFVHFRFPGYETVTFTKAGDGTLPEGWCRIPLSGCLEASKGGTWGKDEADDDHVKVVRVIRGTDMPRLAAGNYDAVPTRYITRQHYRSRLLRPGDLVIEISGGSKDQPVGRTLRIDPMLLSALSLPASFASFCRVMRPIAIPGMSTFLQLELRRIYETREIMQYQKQSTGLSNLRFSDFVDGTMLSRPCDRLLSQFEGVTSGMLALVSNLRCQNANLRAQRNLLLPKLISGEIDLAAAEALPMAAE